MGLPLLVRTLVPMLSTVAIALGLASAAAATITTPRRAAASTSPVLTHPQFVQQLDAICARANREVEPITKAYEAAVNANDPEKAGAILARRGPLYDRWIEQIERLHPPVKDQEALARYTLQVRRIEGLLNRVADALRAGDVAEVERLTPSLNAAGLARHTAAVDLGATHCGSD